MQNARKESQMHSVLCGIDKSGSHEAVGAAIEYCRENGAELRLVGIVKDKFSGPTHGGAGERIRRYKTVNFELDRAAKSARAAGVTALTTVRVGDPIRELVQEANATGSTELFYVRSRGPIRAAITPSASARGSRA
jgi:nucleotide-binding universal stress UspA family protein